MIRKLNKVNRHWEKSVLPLYPCGKCGYLHLTEQAMRNCKHSFATITPNKKGGLFDKTKQRIKTLI